jgi:hypothetical protein
MGSIPEKENYTTLTKETGEDTHKKERNHTLMIYKINVYQNVILSKAISIKIPMTFFSELE